LSDLDKDLQEIGEAIQQGRFDPNRLSPEARTVIDSALQQGLVPGYNSLQDVINVREGARITKAREYARAAMPLEAETGVSMGTFEGAAAATAALINYWLRGDDLTKASIKDAYKSKSKIGMSRFFKAAGDLFEGAKKIPKSKGELVGAVFKELADIIPNTKKYMKLSKQLYNMKDPTVVRTAIEADTIAKTAIASGAAAGAYSIGNSAMDFATNNELDVAKVTNNDLLKLNPAQQMMYSAFEATKNSLLFDGGALGLFSIVGNGLSFGAKFLTGSRGTSPKEVVQRSRELGAPVGLAIAADPNTTMGPIVKGFGEFIGALPLQSSYLTKQKQAFATAVTKSYLKPFTEQSAFGYLGPVQHIETFGYQALPVMKDIYRQSENQIDDLWEGLEAYYRGFDPEGKMDIIQLKQTDKMVDAVRGRFEQDYPEVVRQSQDPNIQNALNQFSPFYSLVKLLNDMGQQNTQYTMGQYINLRKILNAALRDAKPNDKYIPVAENLKYAMETDIANINGKGKGNDIIDMFKRSEVVQSALKKIKDGEAVNLGTMKSYKADTSNPQTVEVMQTAYLNDLKGAIAGMEENLKKSNYMTTRLLSPYDRLTIKNQLRKYDNLIFSQKMLANVVGGASASPETMFNTLFRNTFVKGNTGSVNELKRMLGVNRVMEKGELNPGKEVYRRAKSRFVLDAYLRSFKNPPQLDYKNVQDFMEEAIERGYVPDEYADQLLMNIKNGESIDPYILGVKGAQGLGEIDIRNINISPEELGEFSYDKFLKNLGLDKGNEGYTRLVNIMADGTSKSDIDKGKQALDNLLDLMYIAKEGDSFKVGQPAKLLSRSVALGGAGRITSLAYGKLGPTGTQAATSVGLGIIGGPVAAITTPLIFRTIGTLLTNPDLAANLLKAHTTEEKLARAAGQTGKLNKLLPDAIRAKRRFIAQLLNASIEEDKDKPRIDPDKITDEEIMSIIQNMTTLVPNTTVKIDMLPEDQQQKLFPEYVIYKNAKGTTKKLYDQFLTGLETATAEAKKDDIDGQIPTIDLLKKVQTTEEEGVVVPDEPVQPVQPQERMDLSNIFSGGIDYGTLFPDDPMGEMIAQRRERTQNRG